MTSLAVEERSRLVQPAAGSWAERLLAFAASSHARACLVLTLLGLACFLPGFASLQPMDRDEPRFAQATKQMLETVDFVDIRFQDEARHKKPVGIHWLQSASVVAAQALGVREARTTIAVYRVPSLLGALAMVLLTYWAALAFVPRREAFLAAALIAASVILLVEARLAKTDAVLGACSVAAMGALARAYLARGVGRLPASTIMVFWAAVAFGILIKGPMILLFAGLCVLALSIRERSARWLLPLRPGLGALFTLAVALPWFAAIAVKSGGAFYTAAVGDDLLGKVTTGQQNHWGPPGYYTLAFFATFWPGAAFAAIAAPFAWAHRREDEVAFALAWIVPSWLLFEAFSTKLPHYVMPLYPAVAILTVLAISRGAVGPDRRGARIAGLLIPFFPIGIAVALLAGVWWLDRTAPYAALPVLAAAAFVAVLAWRMFARSEVQPAVLTSVAASVLLVGAVLGLAQPALRSSNCHRVWPRRRAASAAPIRRSAPLATANRAWSSSPD
jgi:4-amino-4-deoxy-L-arabinose transferase-like glycosyltransferase